MIAKNLVMAFSVAATAVAPIPSDSGGDPLSEWERFGPGVEYKDVLAQADAVRAATAKGDRETLERLLAISTDKDQDWGSRAVAINVACDIADATGAERIFTVMESFRDGTKARLESGQDEPPEDVANAHALFLRGFVEQDAEKLVKVLPNDEVALTFLKEFLFSDTGKGLYRRKCYRLIEQCDVPPEMGRTTALEFIIPGKSNPSVPEPVLDLLDEAALPALRARVRAGTKLEDFHLSAAAALAHLGDAQILPVLKARRAAFAAEHPQFENMYGVYFDMWIWKIKVQSPPTRLLDYIATPAPDPPERAEHDWALRRAYRRGIDPGLIRDAILRNHEQAKSTYGRLMLKKLKSEGLRLGILRKGDLPDVELTWENVTP